MTKFSKFFKIIDKIRYYLLVKYVKRPKSLGESNNINEQGYYSQFGQDKWIAEVLLSGKRGGVFVEIGAHDGISISNTYYLEKNLGWNGLAVEPNPNIYNQLKRNRSCNTVNASIGAKDGTSIYRHISGYAEQLSGLVDQYHPTHLIRIKNEINQYGGGYQDIEIICYSINTLLEKYKLHHIDYLSIDVEGGEKSIIEELDFNRFDISVISIENNYGDYQIPKVLLNKGYKLDSIVGDEFYVKTSKHNYGA